MSQLSRLDRAKTETKDRWVGILAALGVPSNALRNEHGPCPMCGGKNRFRFDNLEGRGTWYCNVCGSGDGFQLIMKLRNVSLHQACDDALAVAGHAPVINNSRRALTDRDRKKAMVELWRLGAPIQRGDHVDRYLRSRGIALESFPQDLRTCERASARNGEGRIEAPAMLAAVRSRDGAPATLHRTFLAPDGSGKAAIESPRRLMPGSIPDGVAIRLAEPMDGALGVAEGIETALSASILFEVPVWATLNASIMMSWLPPEGVREVLVFGDNDRSFTGQMAAYTLARKLSLDKRFGCTVSVLIPDRVDADWNDVLVDRMAREAA